MNVVLIIIIILLILSIVYLFLEVKKLKRNQILITKTDKGEIVIMYQNEEIYNYKLIKK